MRADPDHDVGVIASERAEQTGIVHVPGADGTVLELARGAVERAEVLQVQARQIRLQVLVPGRDRVQLPAVVRIPRPPLGPQARGVDPLDDTAVVAAGVGVFPGMNADRDVHVLAFR